MREDADKYGMEYSPYPPYEILKTDKLSYEELLKLKKVEENSYYLFNNNNEYVYLQNI